MHINCNLYAEKMFLKFQIIIEDLKISYSQTCVQRPPSEPLWPVLTQVVVVER
jgi:hypothetical protein